MTALAILSRVAQLGASTLLVGVFVFLLVVARPAFGRKGALLRPALDAFDRRFLRLAAAALAVALGASLLGLWAQTATATGRRLPAALAPEALGSVLAGTRYGHVWLVRLGLAALLAGVLAAATRRRGEAAGQREPEGERRLMPASVSRVRYGLTLRVAGLVLAAAMLAAGAWAGHAGAAEGRALLFQVTADVLHLLAAGAWLGGLVCLALLLGWARRAADPAAAGPEPAAAAAAVAAEATRRFSVLALVAVGLLVQSGLATAWTLVGSVPALIGTRYGRLLLVKVALLLPLLAVAAVNLLREKPRLTGAAADSGGSAARGVAKGSAEGARAEPARAVPEPAGCAAATGAGASGSAAAAAARGGCRVSAGAAVLGRLRRNVLGEAALGAAILVVVGWLGITTPARHDEPVWPLSFRVSTDAMQAVLRLPGAGVRAAAGVNIVFWSLLAFGYAALVPRHRVAAAATGVAGLALGGWVLWPFKPMVVVDAYPTTYVRPAVPYHALSIASGLRLYRAHCAVCHGETGYGDGPRAAGLNPRPANLTAGHTRDHTAGDLFWWITHGIRGSAMSGFGAHLGEEERWDLVNAVRALADSDAAGALRPVPDPTPRIVAPDFAYATAAGEAGALKDFRGRAVVLLVLFSLPDSGGRLAELNEAYERLRRAGAEVLAVPIETSAAAAAAAPRPPVAFPVVVDGGPEAAATFVLFRRGRAIPRHVELLVDRQGYLRARWTPRERDGWDDVDRLVSLAEQLAKEPPRAAPPGEHVH